VAAQAYAQEQDDCASTVHGTQYISRELAAQFTQWLHAIPPVSERPHLRQLFDEELSWVISMRTAERQSAPNAVVAVRRMRKWELPAAIALVFGGVIVVWLMSFWP
jgi:hypothetical protein